LHSRIPLLEDSRGFGSRDSVWCLYGFAVEARDQRCASPGISEFPKGIGVRKSDQDADVMSVFLKICDSPSKALHFETISEAETQIGFLIMGCPAAAKDG
jgi:hypothetical protein